MHQKTSLSEFIEGLSWYWYQKSRALSGIESLTADNFQSGARTLYGEYFLYLVSAIDIVKDFDHSFPSHLCSSLDYFGAGGKNNYEYLRALRHTIIHRGGDITSTGARTADGPQPICPAVLWSNEKPYSRIVPFMNLYIWLCETYIGQTIDAFLNEKGVWCTRKIAIDGFERATKLVANLEHMPPQLKPATIKQLEQNYGCEDIWNENISALRKGLNSEKFSKEEITEMVLHANQAWIITCSFPEA